MSTIPANLFVDVQPGVIGAGGDQLDLICLVLTTGNRVPIGTVQAFPPPAAVADFFGPASVEARVAGGGAGYGSGYFGGFTNADATPGSILFAQYNENAVAAYLWGGDVSAVALATLQALTGSLTVVMDGYSHVISSISLASYSSYSAIAAGIQAAFTDPTEASFTASLGASFTASAGSPTTELVVTAVTGLLSVGDTVIGTGIPAATTILSQISGTPGGAGTYGLSAANTASSASCTSTSNVLDATVIASGTIAVGQTLAGSGVTGTPLITAQIGGTPGGVGTYSISGAQQNVASEAMTGKATAPTVAYDSTSGAFVVTSGITGVASLAAFATGTLATPLLLTSATGAYLSQGAAPATPSTFMAAIVAVTQNWASFMTAFDPDGGSGNTIKMEFAAWVNGTNNRYVYVCWDPDVTPSTQLPATGSMGYLLAQAGYSGTCLIWEPTDYNYAAFVCGSIAAIDFEETNGRITFAFKSQSGLIANVTNETVATNLGGNPLVSGSFGNGYNYYGAVATANQGFVFFQRGVVSGEFEWLDSYVNQIWLNNAFQLALMELLTNAKSIPYNTAGSAMIEAALADPITAGLNFGAFVAGVPLSSEQASEVNAAAGINIAPVLSSRGWYLQIQPASPTTRGSRGSPPMTFWYMDGESVQALQLASILVQ
jgi:hypothetical protein